MLKGRTTPTYSKPPPFLKSAVAAAYCGSSMKPCTSFCGNISFGVKTIFDPSLPKSLNMSTKSSFLKSSSSGVSAVRYTVRSEITEGDFGGLDATISTSSIKSVAVILDTASGMVPGSWTRNMSMSLRGWAG
ncbi:MAG: hypothetical protein DRG37_05165 [Deltaproteobacteria bacterium]|nr:MAG: hypothetical protein DRG37_05165 [Deltaproteobacteria bacterium]